MKVVFDAQEMILVTGNRADGVRPATRALLRNLAIQAEREATKKASGPGTEDPGAYPIPVRTGFFRRAFGLAVAERESRVFNTAIYARALHDGFRPYGNPHAAPIPARPYFDDALEALDLDAAHAAWEASLQ